MSAKKAKSKQKPAVLAIHLKQLRRLFQGWGREVPLALLILAAFSGLWYAVWRQVGRQVLASDRYWLTEAKVEITPQPEWIPGDIRAEVFRDASLDGPVSIMDEELVARIANAFSLHPWVAEVRRVRKHHPACVRVELVYRRPVCVVEARGELLPVDEAGVLLPHLSPNQARKYPRLEGVGTIPIGPEGTRWGDVRVVGGAKIAAAFGPAWQGLSLERIVPSSMVAVDHADEHTYQVVTRGGTRIRWGRPPGMETVGEPPAVDKVAWLLKYQERNGTLEGSDGPQELDVRILGSDSRTAGKTNQAIR